MTHVPSLVIHAQPDEQDDTRPIRGNWNGHRVGVAVVAAARLAGGCANFFRGVRMSAWAQKRTERFRDLWLAGASGKAIARELGLKHPSVYQRAAELGLPRRCVRWTPEREESFRALWLAGVHATEIAQVFGITTNNAYARARYFALGARRETVARHA